MYVESYAMIQEVPKHRKSVITYCDISSLLTLMKRDKGQIVDKEGGKKIGG